MKEQSENELNPVIFREIRKTCPYLSRTIQHTPICLKVLNSFIHNLSTCPRTTRITHPSLSHIEHRQTVKNKKSAGTDKIPYTVLKKFSQRFHPFRSQLSTTTSAMPISPRISYNSHPKKVKSYLITIAKDLSLHHFPSVRIFEWTIKFIIDDHCDSNCTLPKGHFANGFNHVDILSGIKYKILTIDV